MFARFIGWFPDFLNSIVLISNQMIPIKYGNEPKIYGIRRITRETSPKNDGTRPINPGKPCIAHHEQKDTALFCFDVLTDRQFCFDAAFSIIVFSLIFGKMCISEMHSVNFITENQ